MPSQIRNELQPRFEVMVGGVVWYVLIPSHMRKSEHTMFEFDEGATVWYRVTPSHVDVALHSRSFVAVGAVT